MKRKFRPLVPVVFTVLLALGAHSVGQAQGATNGLGVKRPVVAAACIDCPWGTIANILKSGLAPQGYDLQICFTCSRGNNPRIVTGDVKPPLTDPEGSVPPPSGNVDFGITSGANLWAAYQGILNYAKDPPRKQLRLIARVELPQYTVLAVKTSTGITDLGQIRERRLPVRILTIEDATTMPILQYYGITKKEVESWGGSYELYVGAVPKDWDDFDVIIAVGAYLGEAPEVKPLYIATAKYNWRFLDMPDALRQIMVKVDGMELVDMPRSEFRGVDHPIHTVGRSNQVVYARADLPDDFAYLLAKTLDRQRDALRWQHMPLSYDPRTVALLPPVPLHPGAARYYREAGYIK